MKKVFLSLMCIMTVIGFSSCSKKYTCSCTFTDASKNFDVKLEKMRKNDATTVCNDYRLFVGNCALK
jgi:predicted small lipoprotein YifL